MTHFKETGTLRGYEIIWLCWRTELCLTFLRLHNLGKAQFVACGSRHHTVPPTFHEHFHLTSLTSCVEGILDFHVARCRFNHSQTSMSRTRGILRNNLPTRFRERVNGYRVFQISYTVIAYYLETSTYLECELFRHLQQFRTASELSVLANSC